jgi:hypothetical protein
MESVKATQKKYASRAIWIAIIVGLCFFLGGQKPVGKGFILGTIFHPGYHFQRGQFYINRQSPSLANRPIKKENLFSFPGLDLF